MSLAQSGRWTHPAFPAHASPGRRGCSPRAPNLGQRCPPPGASGESRTHLSGASDRSTHDTELPPAPMSLTLSLERAGTQQVHSGACEGHRRPCGERAEGPPSVRPCTGAAHSGSLCRRRAPPAPAPSSSAQGTPPRPLQRHLGTAHTSAGEPRDSHTVACPHDGILFGHKKKRGAGTCAVARRNLGTLYRRTAVKEARRCDSVYTERPGEINPRRQSRPVAAGAGCGGAQDTGGGCRGRGVFLCVAGMFWNRQNRGCSTW